MFKKLSAFMALVGLMVLASGPICRAKSIEGMNKSLSLAGVKQIQSGYTARIKIKVDISMVPNQQFDSTHYVTVSLITLNGNMVAYHSIETNCFEKNGNWLHCSISNLDSTTDWTNAILSVTSHNITFASSEYKIAYSEGMTSIGESEDENNENECYCENCTNDTHSKIESCDNLYLSMVVDASFSLRYKAETEDDKFPSIPLNTPLDVLHSSNYSPFETDHIKTAETSSLASAALQTPLLNVEDPSPESSNIASLANTPMVMGTEEAPQGAYAFIQIVYQTITQKRFTQNNYVNVSLILNDDYLGPINCYDLGEDDGVLNCSIYGVDTKADWENAQLYVLPQGDDDFMFRVSHYMVMLIDENDTLIDSASSSHDTGICYSKDFSHYQNSQLTELNDDENTSGIDCESVTQSMKVDVPLTTSVKVVEKTPSMQNTVKEKSLL